MYVSIYSYIHLLIYPSIHLSIHLISIYVAPHPPQSSSSTVHSVELVSINFKSDASDERNNC